MLIPLTRDRGHEAALASVAQRAREDYQRHGGECDIWIAHAAAADKCERIAIAEVGPTITAHAGPGCIALCIMPV